MSALVKSGPSAISGTDEADLRWYFSVGRRQIEGRSNFGAMLDRLQHFGSSSKPCRACGGKKATLDKDGNVLTPERVGSGFVWSSEDWARRKMLQKLGLLTGAMADAWKGDLVCSRCKGRGVISGRRGGGSRNSWLTMKVKSPQSSQSDTDTGGDASLARLGYVSRLIDRVRSRCSRATAILEAYYSPGGGSEACLWHLTPAGKTMLRRNNLGLPERQFFANERNRQVEDHNTERELLFRAADQQAAELRTYMLEVWCEVRQ